MGGYGKETRHGGTRWTRESPTYITLASLGCFGLAMLLQTSRSNLDPCLPYLIFLVVLSGHLTLPGRSPLSVA